MTALENVLAGALLRERRVRAARASARALARVRATSSASPTGPPRTMTISEQRRLAVARALATEPELLLMDEVMAGLNPRRGARDGRRRRCDIQRQGHRHA